MNFFQLLNTYGSVSRKAIGLVKIYVAVINSFAALGDSSRHRSSAVGDYSRQDALSAIGNDNRHIYER